MPDWRHSVGEGDVGSASGQPWRAFQAKRRVLLPGGRGYTAGTVQEQWLASCYSYAKGGSPDFLRVAGVQAERLREVTWESAAEEGCVNPMRFDELWDSTIKPAERHLYGWEANPWVWVITFERVDRPKPST